MPVGESSRSYVVCPVCGHVFRSTYASTYITVGREADLCPKIPGRPSDGARLIRSAVTMCPVCSFAAGEAFDDLALTFDERHGIEKRLKEDGLLKVFRKGQPPWLCCKEKERPFESTFQLRAMRHFMRSLQEDDLIGRELSVTTYLVGELNRRLGNHREALNWYVNAGRTTEGDPRVAWLDRLIDRQSKLAKEQAA